ncbi:MAG: alpha/beta hydrolase [Sandarakinorhabdus sp.]|nr:alpha/beta hydrolase [Sandarakinorhabdus sp.]
MSQVGVLFLHRFGGSAHSWGAVVARLDQEMEVATPDLPGFGSAAGAIGPFDTAAYADAAGSALDAMASKQLVVVGHSMGGKIALALAALRPARLASLVLLSPSPPTAEPMTDAERAAALAGWGDPAYVAASIERTTAMAISSDAKATEIAGMLQTSALAWHSWFEAGSREDISKALANIEVPATILCGTADHTIPLIVQRREVAARLVDTEIIEIPGAGHLLPVEAPDTVAEAITAVGLKAVSRASRHS